MPIPAGVLSLQGDLKISFDCDTKAVELAVTNQVPNAMMEMYVASKKLVWYGPPWAHYLGGYQDRLLGGPLGLPDLRCTAPAGVKHKTTEEKYSDRKLYKFRTVWRTPRRTRLVLSS
jgi:hypothetical protein